ncbi:Monothiol glutaredoxin-S6, partial [Quillaja saponaria]
YMQFSTTANKLATTNTPPLGLKFLIAKAFKSFHKLLNYFPLPHISNYSFSQQLVAAMDMVKRLVAEKPVVIFSQSNCCMSYSVKSLICSFGANPTVYEIDKIPNGQNIERALLQLGCRSSVPAVFIGEQFIGGASEVISLNVQNKLSQLLIRARAIFIWS